MVCGGGNSHRYSASLDNRGDLTARRSGPRGPKPERMENHKLQLSLIAYQILEIRFDDLSFSLDLFPGHVLPLPALILVSVVGERSARQSPYQKEDDMVAAHCFG